MLNLCLPFHYCLKKMLQNLWWKIDATKIWHHGIDGSTSLSISTQILTFQKLKTVKTGLLQAMTRTVNWPIQILLKNAIVIVKYYIYSKHGRQFSPYLLPIALIVEIHFIFFNLQLIDKYNSSGRPEESAALDSIWHTNKSLVSLTIGLTGKMFSFIFLLNHEPDVCSGVQRDSWNEAELFLVSAFLAKHTEREIHTHTQSQRKQKMKMKICPTFYIDRMWNRLKLTTWNSAETRCRTGHALLCRNNF